LLDEDKRTLCVRCGSSLLDEDERTLHARSGSSLVAAVVDLVVFTAARRWSPLSSISSC
jgi:hypothetical protein